MLSLIRKSLNEYGKTFFQYIMHYVLALFGNHAKLNRGPIQLKNFIHLMKLKSINFKQRFYI